MVVQIQPVWRGVVGNIRQGGEDGNVVLADHVYGHGQLTIHRVPFFLSLIPFEGYGFIALVGGKGMLCIAETVVILGQIYVCEERHSAGILTIRTLYRRRYGITICKQTIYASLVIALGDAVHLNAAPEEAGNIAVTGFLRNSRGNRSFANDFDRNCVVERPFAAVPDKFYCDCFCLITGKRMLGYSIRIVLRQIVGRIGGCLDCVNAMDFCDSSNGETIRLITIVFSRMAHLIVHARYTDFIFEEISELVIGGIRDGRGQIVVLGIEYHS